MTAPGASVPDSSADVVTQRPWSWHASRAAAVLLAVLVPVHFAVTFLVDDIGTTTARSFSARLDDPTWRMVTWLTIALALAHGTLSAGAGLHRRLPTRSGTALTAVVVVVATMAFALASWVLVTRHV